MSKSYQEKLQESLEKKNKPQTTQTPKPKDHDHRKKTK